MSVQLHVLVVECWPWEVVGFGPSSSVNEAEALDWEAATQEKSFNGGFTIFASEKEGIETHLC